MKIPEILIVETVHQPGSLAKVLQVIADAGLTIEHLTALRRDQGRTSWEITLEMDEEADRSLYDRIGQLPTARFVGKSDRVFNRHRGGKIRTVASIPINTLQVLRDIYTPGVARVCLAIEEDPRTAHDFTSLDNTVAIVTNGTAVLGLGNIGALAGLPVMEGKAALFADLVGISGVPILLKETQPDRVVEAIVAIEMSFGAIQLEDFAAPECFEIEQKLQARLQKPVLHDDQHGTAVVALAALINAARHAGRSLRDSVVGQVGLGAAGTGIVRLLRAYGVEHILGADRSPSAIERLEAIGRRGRLARVDHAARGHRHRDDRREGFDQAGMGAAGPGHSGAVESRSGDRAPGGARAGRRLRRRRQGNQQRAGVPRIVQRRARGSRDALLRSDVDGRGGRHRATGSPR